MQQPDFDSVIRPTAELFRETEPYRIRPEDEVLEEDFVARPVDEHARVRLCAVQEQTYSVGVSDRLSAQLPQPSLDSRMERSLRIEFARLGQPFHFVRRWAVASMTGFGRTMSLAAPAQQGAHAPLNTRRSHEWLHTHSLISGLDTTNSLFKQQQQP